MSGAGNQRSDERLVGWIAPKSRLYSLSLRNTKEEGGKFPIFFCGGKARANLQRALRNGVGARLSTDTQNLYQHRGNRVSARTGHCDHRKIEKHSCDVGSISEFPCQRERQFIERFGCVQLPLHALKHSQVVQGSSEFPLVFKLAREDNRVLQMLSRRGEVTLAKASHGTLTALHVFDPAEDTALLRGRGRRFGMSVLVDVHRLGKRSGVAVKGLTATNAKREAEIRRAVRGGRFDLVVMGTSLRQGETKFLGPRTAALLRAIRTPVLLIAR